MAENVSKARLVAAFAAVYVIWGSTYLAIRFAIETLPPFLMAGARFLVAGGLLYAWTTLRAPAERPTWRQWRAAAIVGVALLMGGNGGVVWAEQYVASGAVALLVATVPLWMVVLAWLWRGEARPGARTIGGIILGLAGIGLLVGPEALGEGKVDPVGAVVVLLAALSWASGSLYARSASLPKSPLLATAMEMIAGGAALAIAGVLTGEVASVDLGAVSLRSAAALAYLVVFGSLIGFTAYVWLLGKARPALVATYAYVNPLVAVLLGWAFASEPLGARTLLAAGVVLGAVALITTARDEKRVPRAEDPSLPGGVPRPPLAPRSSRSAA